MQILVGVFAPNVHQDAFRLSFLVEGPGLSVSMLAGRRMCTAPMTLGRAASPGGLAPGGGGGRDGAVPTAVTLLSGSCGSPLLLTLPSRKAPFVPSNSDRGRPKPENRCSSCSGYYLSSTPRIVAGSKHLLLSPIFFTIGKIISEGKKRDELAGVQMQALAWSGPGWRLGSPGSLRLCCPGVISGWPSV